MKARVQARGMMRRENSIKSKKRNKKIPSQCMQAGHTSTWIVNQRAIATSSVCGEQAQSARGHATSRALTPGEWGKRTLSARRASLAEPTPVEHTHSKVDELWCITLMSTTAPRAYIQYIRRIMSYIIYERSFDQYFC